MRCSISALVFLYSHCWQIKKDTTWKDVKDFLRGGKVEVDNVAVFPNAQNGWVRVFSRRNYDAAISMP